MSEEIIQNISIFANICTILAFFIALITLVFYWIADTKKVEQNVRMNFLKNKIWSNEYDIHSNENTFITLNIDDDKRYFFSGSIEFSHNEIELFFYFKKQFRKNLTFEIHKAIGSRLHDRAIVKVKMIYPGFFSFELINDFEQEDLESKLPLKTTIRSIIT